jgi:FtsP/CotA-like multicopper oxidase with cupredoxin domain
MLRLDRSVKHALELRHQLSAAKLGRRELAKLGLIAGSAYYARGASLRAALAKDAPSPKLEPWEDELPIPRRAEASGYDYDHSGYQWCNRFDAAPANCYRLRVQEHDHQFHKDLPASRVWSYGDEFGGPLLDVRYGQPFCIRIENELPADHKGYAHPEITTHLHNFHTATESDGGPWNWVSPGGSRVQHYCMARAGFTGKEADFADPLAPGGTWWAKDGGDGDLRETLTTLFMHDHMPEFTSPNLYKGLFMMVRTFDQDDTGDENTGWRLPSGEYDVPLMFQDKRIDPSTGEMTYNQFAVDGFLGDLITVNGKYQPFMKVKRRKYRFRLLNGGPSRFYNLVLREEGVSKNIPFTQITQSGNLLVRPKTVSSTDIWVAERNDIIIDFSKYKKGTVLYLSNILQMRDDGRGEDVGKTLNPDQLANQVLRFEVGGKEDDPSQVPSYFRPLPPLPDLSKLPRKTFKFERKNGQWAINGRFWDPDADHEDVLRGIAPAYQVDPKGEIWTLDSSSGGWDHPMHIHFEEGQIISQNGVKIAEGSRFRTDIYRLRQNKMEIVMRFRDFPQGGFSSSSGTPQTAADHGRYVMHCHNVTHEDHAMMVTWSIKA